MEDTCAHLCGISRKHCVSFLSREFEFNYRMNKMCLARFALAHIALFFIRWGQEELQMIQWMGLVERGKEVALVLAGNCWGGGTALALILAGICCFHITSLIIGFDT